VHAQGGLATASSSSATHNGHGGRGDSSRGFTFARWVLLAGRWCSAWCGGAMGEMNWAMVRRRWLARSAKAWRWRHYAFLCFGEGRRDRGRAREWVSTPECGRPHSPPSSGVQPPCGAQGLPAVGHGCARQRPVWGLTQVSETRFSALYYSWTVVHFGKPVSPFCRATRVLEVCLMMFCQIPNGFQTKNPKIGLLRNCNSANDLKKIQVSKQH
jgi:hypothetical protein